MSAESRLLLWKEGEVKEDALAMVRAYWQDLVDRGLIPQAQADKNVRRWAAEQLAQATNRQY